MTNPVRTEPSADFPRALPRRGRAASLGTIRRLFRDPQPVLDQLAEEFGPICGLGFGPIQIAIIGDPTLLHELFTRPSESFTWGHRYNLLGFVVGNGSMLVSDGADHARRRSSVHTAFSRKRLNGWIPMIVERTDEAIDEVIDRIDGSAVLDMYQVGRSLVLETVIRALFGEELGDRANEIGARFQSAQDYLEAPALRQLPHPIPFTARSRVRADRRALDAIIDDAMAERRAQPSSDPLDILEALVVDETLDDDEIRDQVVTLMGAGYDTTAATLAWIMWRTTLTPGLWQRLGAEADTVLGPVGSENRSHGPDTLSALDLSGRVMRETMRLHPAGVVAPRQAAVDVTVGGYRIPAGTLILWSAYLAGRDASTWSKPLEFDPERFVGLDDAQRRVTNAAWVPFGRGPRSCIGQALAQMELTLIVSRMAQRLDLDATGADVPRPVGMVVNRPQGGVPVRVTPRKP